jgi:hypothetical protein
MYSDGEEAWYGTWWVGPTRVKRKLGARRKTSTADGLTRTQAERELRRRMETERVVARPRRADVRRAPGAPCRDRRELGALRATRLDLTRAHPHHAREAFDACWADAGSRPSMRLFALTCER